jgi:hypothetical protein
MVLGINKRPDREINYGSGADVSEESIADGRTPVKIRWYGSSYIELSDPQITKPRQGAPRPQAARPRPGRRRVFCAPTQRAPRAFCSAGSVLTFGRHAQAIPLRCCSPRAALCWRAHPPLPGPLPSSRASPHRMLSLTRCTRPICRAYPEKATSYGDYRYNDRLSDYSLAALKSQHARDESFLARLRAISTAGFPDQDALSHEVLRSILEQLHARTTTSKNTRCR